MIVTLLAMFGAGLASFVAPCVLPVVPGILGALAGPGAAPGRSVVPAAGLFVAGFASVFVALGSGAGLLGDAVGSPAVARVGGVLVVLLGVALLTGRPARVVRWRPQVTGPAGAFVLGLVFGAGWTPCVGPLVGAALVAAGGTGSPAQGALALAAYAAGLGAPVLALAAGVSWSARVQRFLRRGGVRLAQISGVVLVVVGAAMALARYDDLVSALRP